MSYDLIFWRQEQPIDLAPAEIYGLLHDGEPPAGVVPLPVDQIAPRLDLAFPALQCESGETTVQTDTGSFEVYLDEHYCSVTVHGPCTTERNTIVGIMAEFGCPLYDPQTDERHDDEGGTASGDPPVFEGLTTKQQRTVAEIRARILDEPRGMGGVVRNMLRGLVQRVGQDPQAGIGRAERAVIRSVRAFPLTIDAWAVRDDDLYLATARNSVHGVEHNAIRCLDPSWNERWSVEGSDATGISVVGDALYVTDRDLSTSKGYVQRIDRAGGNVIWARELRGADSVTDAATTDRYVLVGGWDKLWALRRDDGKTAWTKADITLSARPLVAEEHDIVLAGDREGTLHGLDPRTGKPRWDRMLSRYAEAYHAAGAWWAGGRETPLERIDPETGDRLGALRSPCCSTMVEAAGRLYFLTRDSDEKGYRMACFEAATSKLEWEVDLPFHRGTCLWSPRPLGVREQRLIVRTHSGPVYTLDAASGRMLSFFGLEEAQRHNPDARETGAVLLLPTGQVVVQVRGELLELDL